KSNMDGRTMSVTLLFAFDKAKLMSEKRVWNDRIRMDLESAPSHLAAHPLMTEYTRLLMELTTTVEGSCAGEFYAAMDGLNSVIHDDGDETALFALYKELTHDRATGDKILSIDPFPIEVFPVIARDLSRP